VFTFEYLVSYYDQSGGIGQQFITLPRRVKRRKDFDHVLDFLEQDCGGKVVLINIVAIKSKWPIELLADKFRLVLWPITKKKYQAKK
jgi:hypothetical protein